MKAFFIDRDGVINDDTIAYLRDPDDVVVYPYVPEAMKMIKTAGYEIFIVSNQSGIADKMISPGELDAVSRRIESILQEQGAPIPRKWFYCPHKMDSDCRCRKPSPGLLQMAAEEFGVDLSRSFIIGDRMSDIACGVAAGCSGGVHVLSGYGMNIKNEPLPENYFRAENLLEAVKLLLR